MTRMRADSSSPIKYFRWERWAGGEGRVWLALFLTLLTSPLCLSLTALGAQRVDLFHAAFVNACTGRTYQVHWQDARRYPQDFRYDFFLSPDSLVVLEIWLEGAPTISFSRTFPLDCPSRG